jgi:hypothetical protein
MSDVESELEDEEMTDAFLLRSANEGGKEGSVGARGSSTRIMQ